MSYLKSVLGANAFWSINKVLVSVWGIDNVFLFQYLLDCQSYYESKDELDGEGFFYRRSEDIEKDTNISYYQQRKAINFLTKLGVLETAKKGFLNRQCFKINEDESLKNLKSSVKKTSSLEFKKLKDQSLKNFKSSVEVFSSHNNNIYNKNIENKNIENNIPPISPNGGDENESSVSSKNQESEKNPPRCAPPSLVYPFTSDRFISMWNVWVDYRKEKRKKMTETTMQAQLKFLGDEAKGEDIHAIRIIEQSIRNGWQGLFKLKDDKGRSNGSKSSFSANEAVSHYIKSKGY